MLWETWWLDQALAFVVGVHADILSRALNDGSIMSDEPLRWVIEAIGDVKHRMCGVCRPDRVARPRRDLMAIGGPARHIAEFRRMDC